MKIVLAFEATIYAIALADLLTANGCLVRVSKSKLELEKSPKLTVCDLALFKKSLNTVRGKLDLEKLILIVSHDQMRDNLSVIPEVIGGLVCSANPPTVLLKAIKAVDNDSQFIDTVFRELIESRSELSEILLTPRQIQIIRLVADGSSSREIALQLSLSHRTVENHRARAMERLCVNSAAEMIDVARRHGWI